MASNTQELVDVLSALVKTTWDTATSSAPLFFDNMPSAPPEGTELWGRLHIREQASSIAALSGKYFRRNGTLYLQVFVRKDDAGTVAINAVTDAVREALEDATPAQLGNVWLRDTVVKPVGASDETYFQQNVETSFTYDRVT